MDFKPARLDTLSQVTSIITSLFLIGLSFFFLMNRIPFNGIFVLMMLAIPLVSYLLSPKKYYVQGGNFVIEKMIGKKIFIPLSEIENVFEIEDFYKLKPLRALGNGGLFGYYGIYTTKDYGNVNCQLTRMKKVVLIKTKRGYYAISPEKPEVLLNWFNSLTGKTTTGEIPESRAQRKKANPLILLLPDTICVSMLIMVILLYPQLPDKIATHFDLQGNPDGWSPRISFVYLGIIPQVVMLAITVSAFFIMRNKFHEPKVIYLLIIMVSVIQLIVAYTSFDIYWFNVHKYHLFSMNEMFLFFTGLFLILLYLYYRALTNKRLK
ncbi:MAG: PH domain-containing protein [candidate division WOR-3 bacterium]